MMKEECRNCKSFKPNSYPLDRGNSTKMEEIPWDGICQKDQQRHDTNDSCDDFEPQNQESQQSNDLSQ